MSVLKYQLKEKLIGICLCLFDALMSGLHLHVFTVVQEAVDCSRWMKQIRDD